MPDRDSILVIEDDRTLARGLRMNLEMEGFSVRHAADGRLGLRLALDDSPGLVLLDLMVPGIDGFEIIAALRERSRDTVVLVLSARSEVIDKVEALGLGADDYMTKPFSLKELVARIRANLRRPRWDAGGARLASFADVEVDLDARTVLRAGQPVPLTAREFDLLTLMMSRPGRTFTREALLRAVWRHDYEGTTRTVDNFVRSLRSKLERLPRRPCHIVTVRVWATATFRR